MALNVAYICVHSVSTWKIVYSVLLGGVIYKYWLDLVS